MNFIIDFYDLFVNGPLMDDLLDERIDLFGTLFYTLAGSTLVGVVFYYYVLNGRHRRSSKFAAWGYWLAVLLTCAGLTLAAHFVTCLQMAEKLIPRNPKAPANQITYFFDQPDSVFAGFAGQAAGLSIALFFILSILLKWGSGQAKKSPF